MMKTIARQLALLLLLPCAACAATLEQRQVATARLDAVWAAENAKARSEFGSRTVTATPDQVLRATRSALTRIGLTPDATVQPPRVSASSLFAGSNWSWSTTVRQAEEPRMRQVFVEAIGPTGSQLKLQPGSEIITGSAIVNAVTRTTSGLTINFRTAPPGGYTNCQNAACITEMPPAALRAAFYEFWNVFDAELIEVRQEDAAKAAAAALTRKRGGTGGSAKPRPKPATPARPPSDWTLPPSGWAPPPK